MTTAEWVAISVSRRVTSADEYLNFHVDDYNFIKKPKYTLVAVNKPIYVSCVDGRPCPFLPVTVVITHVKFISYLNTMWRNPQFQQQLNCNGASFCTRTSLSPARLLWFIPRPLSVSEGKSYIRIAPVVEWELFPPFCLLRCSTNAIVNEKSVAGVGTGLPPPLSLSLSPTRCCNFISHFPKADTLKILLAFLPLCEWVVFSRGIITTPLFDRGSSGR